MSAVFWVSQQSASCLRAPEVSTMRPRACIAFSALYIRSWVNQVLDTRTVKCTWLLAEPQLIFLWGSHSPNLFCYQCWAPTWGPACCLGSPIHHLTLLPAVVSLARISANFRANLLTSGSPQARSLFPPDLIWLTWPLPSMLVILFKSIRHQEEKIRHQEVY